MRRFLLSYLVILCCTAATCGQEILAREWGQGKWRHLMRLALSVSAIAVCVFTAPVCGVLQGATARRDATVKLPEGVEVVWGLEEASSESTKTQERICINGLWRWQPADEDTEHCARNGGWGYFKVPGSWPGITDYMQKDCQTVYMPIRTGKTVQLGGSVTAGMVSASRSYSAPAEWTRPAHGPSARRLRELICTQPSTWTARDAGAIIRFPGGEA